MSMHNLDKLQQWYLGQCNGEWEHDYGITIGTLDNPGWFLDVDLAGTNKAETPFERVREERSDDDWVDAWVENRVFHATCGPMNLGEVLEMFVSWATT